jgi:hypothetical protein
MVIAQPKKATFVGPAGMFCAGLGIVALGAFQLLSAASGIPRDTVTTPL